MYHHQYKNSNSFSQLLLLVSGNINLNSGPFHQDTVPCLNEWNTFQNNGLHFIHLNTNSLLSNIEGLHFIAKSTNAVANRHL